MLVRLNALEQQTAALRVVIGTLRMVLRQAFAVIERSASPTELLTQVWYRRGKEALGARTEDDTEMCSACGAPGGR